MTASRTTVPDTEPRSCAEVQSDLSGFYHLSMAQRRAQLAAACRLSEEELRIITGEAGLCAELAGHIARLEHVPPAQR